MRFLTNTHNPSDPDAKRYPKLSSDDALSPQGREQAWNRHLDWLRDKTIGEPQGTEKYSVEELKKMGMVGVYKRD